MSQVEINSKCGREVLDVVETTFDGYDVAWKGLTVDKNPWGTIIADAGGVDTDSPNR